MGGRNLHSIWLGHGEAGKGVSMGLAKEVVERIKGFGKRYCGSGVNSQGIVLRSRA